MSERYEEALDELRQLRGELFQSAEDTGYGYFPGGDPNDFTPDAECCSPEEIARHKEACAAWPEVKYPAPHCGLGGLQVPPPGFGIGTYVMRDETVADWADRLNRCINRLERE